MAIVTKTRTYSTGDILTANFYNEDRDEIIAGVNSIVDAQIAGNAAISLTKLAGGQLPVGITVTSDNIVDGTIQNVDISPTAAIETSKLATENLASTVTVTDDNLVDTTISDVKINYSGAAGEYPQSNGDGTISWQSVVVNRAFTWFLPGSVTTGNEKGVKYIAPQNMSAVKIMSKLSSGSAIIRVQRDTTTIEGNIAVSTSVTTVDTGLDSPNITNGQVITLDVTSATSAQDLIVTVECEQ